MIIIGLLFTGLSAFLVVSIRFYAGTILILFSLALMCVGFSELQESDNIRIIRVKKTACPDCTEVSPIEVYWINRGENEETFDRVAYTWVDWQVRLHCTSCGYDCDVAGYRDGITAKTKAAASDDDDDDDTAITITTAASSFESELRLLEFQADPSLV